MRLLNLSLTFTLSLAALMLLAWGIAAAPVARYVAPRADCSTATPCYATLQAAIDAVDHGQRSTLGSGAVQYSYVINGETIIVRGI